MSAEQTPDIAAVLAEHLYNGCTDPACDPGSDPEVCIRRPFLNHVAAALAPVLAAAVREAEQRAWDEAAELADTQIVLWSGVPGLRPEAQEPHPAAIAAAGARRTLVVLRSRMTEAFRVRADRITEPVSHEAATSGEEASKA